MVAMTARKPETARFTVAPRLPYSLALTAARYARFPEVVDRFDGRVYRRLLPAGRGTVVEVEQAGPPFRARLAVTLTGPQARSAAARAAAEALVVGPLGAGADVRRFSRALSADPVIGRAIRDFPGLRIAGAPSLWEAIVTAVLAQQVNLLFAYDIRRELALAFGPRARTGDLTWHGFPAPGSLLAEARRVRRDFRLSRAKAQTILLLAEAFASGHISQEAIADMPDEDAIEHLTAVRGVGRWTAEVSLLRGLGREDVFPAADLGVVQYLATGLLGRPARARESEMREYAERWRPWRGLALVYAYAELQRRREAEKLAAGRRITRSPRSPSPAGARQGSEGRRRR
jgi:DNA-3-methyladenine glycosylase II